MGICLSCCRARGKKANANEGVDPPAKPEDPVIQLYREAAAAWSRYTTDAAHGLPDLAETIEKCNKALGAAEKGHRHRNDILLLLVFALLEQDLEQPSLEKIEEYFSELEGGSELENDRKVDARAIAAKLAAGYHQLYNQAPSDSNLKCCVLKYSRVRKYSDKPEDLTATNLDLVTLYRQGGQLEAAMGVIESAKSTCPPDRPDLLSSLLMAKHILHQDIYRSNKSSTELEKAIAAGEAALQVQFDMLSTQRAAILAGVAQCIYALSEAQPTEVEFEGRVRAIKYAREAVELNVGEDSRIRASIALANALSSRRITPTIQELDEAIGLYRKANEAPQRDPELLASLANAICFRCEKGGEVHENGTTVQSAVELYEEALATSSHNRWNSRIANNIAFIYVEKANNTKAEADYEKARENYLKAANYLQGTGSDLGDANDMGYYRDQADAVTETIARLKEGTRGASTQHSSESGLTPKRRSTARGSV